MGDQPGQRSDDPNGLVVRRGGWSFEVHGKAALLVLCTALILGAIVYEGREVQRVLADHEATYQRSIEEARGMIRQFGLERRAEHQGLDRRVDILTCASRMTDAEWRWARGQRAVTWDDRCPWITAEPK